MGVYDELYSHVPVLFAPVVVILFNHPPKRNFLVFVFFSIKSHETDVEVTCFVLHMFTCKWKYLIPCGSCLLSVWMVINVIKRNEINKKPIKGWEICFIHTCRCWIGLILLHDYLISQPWSKHPDVMSRVKVSLYPCDPLKWIPLFSQSLNCTTTIFGRFCGSLIMASPNGVFFFFFFKAEVVFFT